MNSTNQQSFENITWFFHEELKHLYLDDTKENLLETLKTLQKPIFDTPRIYFHENKWDFYSTTTLSRKRNNMVMNFELIPECFRDVVKLIFYFKIISKKNKIVTLNLQLHKISIFSNYAYENGWINFSQIPVEVYKNFLKEWNVQYNTECAAKGIFKDFLIHYGRFFEEIPLDIINFLSERNLNLLSTIKDEMKTPDIDEIFFNSLMKVCIRTINDDNEDEKWKILASLLLILSQTGLRMGELVILETNQLKEEFFDNEKVIKYLVFKTFKKVRNSEKTENARCISTELLEIGYNYLEQNEKLKQLRKKYNKDLLFINDNMGKNNAPSISALSKSFKKFYLHNCKELNILNNPEQWENFEHKIIRSFVDTDRKNEVITWAGQENVTLDDMISYPKSHQFRVHVCTELYNKGYPIQYIQLHMTHLSEDMTTHYIRPNENSIKNETAKSVYTHLVTKDVKLLGTNANELMDKIDNFINNDEYKLVLSTDEIIEKVADEYPIRQKSGGFCIKPGDIYKCEHEDLSDEELFCSYGMCANSVHNLTFVGFYYEVLTSLTKGLKHNIIEGFDRAAEKEYNKGSHIIDTFLIPELNEIKKQLTKHTKEELISDFPLLENIISNFDDIYQEVLTWKETNKLETD